MPLVTTPSCLSFLFLLSLSTVLAIISFHTLIISVFLKHDPFTYIECSTLIVFIILVISKLVQLMNISQQLAYHLCNVAFCRISYGSIYCVNESDYMYYLTIRSLSSHALNWFLSLLALQETGTLHTMWRYSDRKAK